MNMKFLTTCTHSVNSFADRLSAFLHGIGNAAFQNLFPDGTRSRHVQKIAEILFSVLCALSVVSQTDIISRIPCVRICVILLWGIAFLYGLAVSRLHIDKKTILCLIPVLLFDPVVLCISLVTRRFGIYIASPIFYAVNLSAFVFVTGAVYQKFTSNHLLSCGIKTYLLCTAAVAVYTILTTFSKGSLSSYLYLYAQKNSLAPIVLTAVACIMFLKPFKHDEWHTPLLMLLGTFLVLLKSRVNLIGFCIVLMIWFFLGIRDKETRKRVFLNIATAAILIVVVATLRELFVDNILLNHRASEGLNAVTSGRTEQITDVLTSPPTAPAPSENGTESAKHSVPFLVGSGSTYIESLPLAAVLSYGIFASIPLILFAFVPLICAKLAGNSASGNKEYALLLFALSVAFLCSGLFEERAPFGPGVTYFLLWFLSGYFSAAESPSS